MTEQGSASRDPAFLCYICWDFSYINTRKGTSITFKFNWSIKTPIYATPGTDYNLR